MAIADLKHSERMRWLWRALAWPLAFYIAAAAVQGAQQKHLHALATLQPRG